MKKKLTNPQSTPSSELSDCARWNWFSCQFNWLCSRVEFNLLMHFKHSNIIGPLRLIVLLMYFDPLNAEILTT